MKQWFITGIILSAGILLAFHSEEPLTRAKLGEQLFFDPVLSGDSLHVWSLGPFIEVPAGTSSLAVSVASGHSPLPIEGEAFSNLSLEAGKSYTAFLYKVPGKSATGGAIITHHKN